MHVTELSRISSRYAIVSEVKEGGATYTPKMLSDFVAAQIVKIATAWIREKVDKDS